MNFTKSLQQNVKMIKRKLYSSDVVYFNFTVADKNAVLVYIDPLIDKVVLGSSLLIPLEKCSTSAPDEIKNVIASPNVKTSADYNGAIEKAVDGWGIILIDGENKCLQVDLKKVDQRAISEPPTSSVIKGPREGFIESIKSNVSLLRKRLKSPELIIEYLEVGKYSKTTVAVCFIKSIADLKIVKEVKKRLKAIDIDGIYDSSSIALNISEHKKSLFKQVGTTEKPDILMAKMLEGRIGIIVDGSPIALSVPYLLVEDFQSADDYFILYYRANMERLLRLVSVIFSVYLPALFVAAELFHLQLIPLNFLLTIINSIKGIPLSPSFEMFFTLLIFEMLNEASIRMPKYVGMALSIVGALVVGDTAVRAGIVSTPTIMIMALSGICIYTVPELVDTLSVLRLAFLLVAGTSGVYGIILLTCFLILYLCSMENFGIPLLAPFAPIVKNDLKDSFYITYLNRMRTRPFSLKPKNVTRQVNHEKKEEQNAEDD